VFIFQYNIINVTYLQEDEAVLKAVVSVLTAKERALGHAAATRNWPASFWNGHLPRLNLWGLSYAL